MAFVRVREGESLDSALKRFKRMVEKKGTPKELRKREFFQKKSVVKKRKAAAARKRHLKRLFREAANFGGRHEEKK